MHTGFDCSSIPPELASRRPDLYAAFCMFCSFVSAHVGPQISLGLKRHIAGASPGK